ncbi:MAG: chromate transporter [Erysipelotrichaceae bacterium]|nr:chromate transporter [Erysipelotrichaceae bacterium]
MKQYIEFFMAWFRIGLFTFGGGYAMLPMIEKEIIDKHHWTTEDDVMNYYAIAQCTPGVIAVNVATFVGYFQKGILGAIVCTIGLVTPSILIISMIAGVLTSFSELAIVQHALSGIRIAVCILMSTSIVKLFKKGVVDMYSGMIFVSVLLMAMLTQVSTVLLVVVSGMLGVIFSLVKVKTGGKQA